MISREQKIPVYAPPGDLPAAVPHESPVSNAGRFSAKIKEKNYFLNVL
jgi:hypothetical protein